LNQNQLPPAQLFSAQLPPNQLTPALAGGRIDCVLLALAKIFHHNSPLIIIWLKPIPFFSS